jgi:DNA-binding MarR family transcriptional regulator
MGKRTNVEIQAGVELVAKALRSKKSGGCSRGELARKTGLEPGQVADAVRRLRESGDVLIEGDKRLARYYHRENVTKGPGE